MLTNYYSIAIDGPAGSGKSSVAKLIAKKLNWLYISTGNMFRAYAWLLSMWKISQDDCETIYNALKNIEVILDNDLVFVHDLKNLQKYEISQEIKSPEIACYASKIATYLPVREKLLIDQRTIANNNNVVMDGRDIGSVVLPNATLKIYLDASIEARTERRVKELLEKDSNLIYNKEDIFNSIKKRDFDDTHRAIAPLILVADAYKINNDNLTLIETMDQIIDLLNQKLLKMSS